MTPQRAASFPTFKKYERNFQKPLNAIQKRKEMIKMTVDEILNAELTEEELDKVIYVLNKRKEEILNIRTKKAFIDFEKAFTNLMTVAPCKSMDIDFVNDEDVHYTIDILDVLENYFYNASAEYHIY